MKKEDRYTTIAVSGIVFTGLLIYACLKLAKSKKLRNISNEGYEMAHDILYPNKDIRKAKLHYGPVLPVNDF